MAQKSSDLSKIIWKHFLDYYSEFINISVRAPELFSAGELDKRLDDDLLRVQLYRSSIDKSVAISREILGFDSHNYKKWKQIRKQFYIKYGDELATTYLTSVMRKVFSEKDISIEFKNDGVGHNLINTDKIIRHYSINSRDDLEKTILQVFSDSIISNSRISRMSSNISIIVDLINEELMDEIEVVSIEILRPVFYRGKGAYLVGQLRTNSELIPVVFCVVHTTDGVDIDAVLVGHKATRNFLFSSTRSAFTVLTSSYRELYSFIQKLFPLEIPAYIFDLIGFTHPAKISLLQDLREITRNGEQCQYIGTGPVDLVFGLEGFPLVFKVLKRRLPDRKNIIANFLKVHETDRLGQVLDSFDYRNLKFRLKFFSDDLINKLKEEESEDIVFTSKHIFFKRLYASRRITQVPEYIRSADKKDIQQVLMGVGWNIKHLAAMGFLPRSLGLEHFGFTKWGRVVYLNNASLIDIKLVLFRYQAKTTLGVERYSANPTDFERELNIPLEHRDMFRAVHGDLYFPEFWEEIKVKVYNGIFPDIYPYPARYRLGSRRFRCSLLEELQRLNDSADDKQIRIVLDTLAVIDIELAGLRFLRLEVPYPSARVLVVEPIGPEIIAQLHRKFEDVTFDILQSESEIVESAGQWTPGIHGKLKALVQLRKYDYVIGYVNESFDYDFFRLAKLKGFLLLSTGTHNIDVEAATVFHTVVTNAPGPTTTTVSEQNIGLLLDAIYSINNNLGNEHEKQNRLINQKQRPPSPLITARIMWLSLLRKILKLDEMFAFGSSQHYVRTGVGKHATVYHDQLGQNKEAGINRSIGVIGLGEIGQHIIEFAIIHEISTIYVLDREYWALSSDEKDRLEEVISLIKHITYPDNLSIQLISVNKTALLDHATYTFNTESYGLTEYIKEHRQGRIHIDLQDLPFQKNTHTLDSSNNDITLGIQGLGRIGMAVAQRAIALGINVLVYQRDPGRFKYQEKQRKLLKLADHRSIQLGQTLSVEYAQDKDTFFKRSNIITTLAATTENTRGWVDQKGLEQFASDAPSPVRVIVSAGKGLVDEAALLNYLKQNPDVEARLDVLIGEHEGGAYLKLIDNNGSPLSNLKVTGHTAAAVREVRQLKIFKALKNLRSLIDGIIPPNIVNNSITKGKATAIQSIIGIEGLRFFRIKVPAPKARVLVIEPLSPEIILHIQRLFGDVSFDILLAESELVNINGKWSPGINARLNDIVYRRNYDYCLGYCNANFDAEFFEKAQLKGLILFASAIHHIDFDMANLAGTIVTNAPGFTTVAVTEQNIGMILDALYGRYLQDHESVGSISLSQLMITEPDQARTIAQIMWFILLKQALKLDAMFKFGRGGKYVRTGIRQDATVYHDQLGQYDQAGINNSIGIIGLDEVGLNLVELAIVHELSTIYVLDEEYTQLTHQQKSRLAELSELMRDISQASSYSVQVVPVDRDVLIKQSTYTIKTPVAYKQSTLRAIKAKTPIHILADKIHINDLHIFSRSLIGLTLGVQGLGRIGEAVVQRALALGANTIVCQRNPERPEYQEKLTRLRRLATNREGIYRHTMGVEYVNKDQLFKASNIVTTLAATTTATRYWVDRQALDMLGTETDSPVKVLVNAGKGLLNEADLALFLTQHQDVEIRLDVLSDEQKGEAGCRFTDADGRLLPNLKISGHTAAAVPELRRLKIFYALNNLRLHIDGQKPNNILNEEALISQSSG